jgi:hypothetical protein
MTTYLVTGDAGMLGSRIKALLPGARGYDVKRGQNILDLDALVAAFRGVDVVVHCAGLPHPTSDPFPHFFRVNVQGTANVCRAAASAGVGRMVYISSTAWYGADAKGGFLPLYLPVDEAHPPNPQGARNVYGASKRMAEDVLAWYGTNHVFETAVVRSGPANSKAGQYPGPVDWRSVHDWRWGCLWANDHPDHAARAVALVAQAEGPFWHEVFNATDRYVSMKVDFPAFIRDRAGLAWDQRSPFDISKLEALGWEPSDER